MIKPDNLRAINPDRLCAPYKDLKWILTLFEAVHRIIANNFGFPPFRRQGRLFEKDAFFLRRDRKRLVDPG